MYQSLTIIEFHKVSLHQFSASHVCLYPRSLWYLALVVVIQAGSIRGGIPLLEWVSCWTSHWLATPTISVPPLLHKIWEAGPIAGWRLCDWFGAPLSPLEFLLGYRRWSVQGTCPLLLSFLAKVTLADSCEFWLHLVSNSPPNVPHFPILFSSTTQPDPICWHSHPPPIYPWNLFQFPFPGRSKCSC